MLLFQSIPRAKRRRLAERFLEVTKERDGEPDLCTRRLKRRAENRMRRGMRPMFTGVVPHEEYVAARRAGSPCELAGFGRFALWLAALAGVNQAEDFGVRLFLARRKSDNPEDVMFYIELEELEHGALIADAAGACGVSLERTDPRGFMRFFLMLISLMPAFVRNVLVFMAEIVGVEFFLVLREEGERQLAAHPGARDWVFTNLTEILVDEVGHVLYLKTQLNWLQLVVVRLLFKRLVPHLLRPYPATVALFGEDVLIRRILAFDPDKLPEDVRSRSFSF